jgi:uncharacterized protein (DUF1778 family)
MEPSKTRTINIRATNTQYNNIKEFARFRGKSVSALLLDSVWEQIEDWEDIRDYEVALQSNEKSYSWDDVQKQAGLA